MDKFDKDLKDLFQKQAIINEEQENWLDHKVNNLERKKQPQLFSLFKKHRLASVVITLLFVTVSIFAASNLQLFETSKVPISNDKAIARKFQNKQVQNINQTIENDEVKITINDILVDSKAIYFDAEVTLKSKKDNLIKYPYLNKISILNDDGSKIKTQNSSWRLDPETLNYVNNKSRELYKYTDISNKQTLKDIIKNNKSYKLKIEEVIINRQVKKDSEEYQKYQTLNINKTIDFKLDNKINSIESIKYHSDNKDIKVMYLDNTSLNIEFILNESKKSYDNYEVESTDFIDSLNIVTKDGTIIHTDGFEIKSNYQNNKYQDYIKVSFPITLQQSQDQYKFTYNLKSTNKFEAIITK